MTTTPRIHAEFIKAWAEGYDIEAYNPERGQWIVCPEPGWFADIEYRVRPGTMEPREPVYEEYVVRVDQDLFDADKIQLQDECQHYQHYNLKLLFEDGKLINSEVMVHDEDDLPW